MANTTHPTKDEESELKRKEAQNKEEHARACEYDSLFKYYFLGLVAMFLPGLGMLYSLVIYVKGSSYDVNKAYYQKARLGLSILAPIVFLVNLIFLLKLFNAFTANEVQSLNFLVMTFSVLCLLSIIGFFLFLSNIRHEVPSVLEHADKDVKGVTKKKFIIYRIPFFLALLIGFGISSYSFMYSTSNIHVVERTVDMSLANSADNAYLSEKETSRGLPGYEYSQVVDGVLSTRIVEQRDSAIVYMKNAEKPYLVITQRCAEITRISTNSRVEDECVTALSSKFDKGTSAFGEVKDSSKNYEKIPQFTFYLPVQD